MSEHMVDLKWFYPSDVEKVLPQEEIGEFERDMVVYVRDILDSIQKNNGVSGSIDFEIFEQSLKTNFLCVVKLVIFLGMSYSAEEAAIANIQNLIGLFKELLDIEQTHAMEAIVMGEGGVSSD